SSSSSTTSTSSRAPTGSSTSAPKAVSAAASSSLKGRPKTSSRSAPRTRRRTCSPCSNPLTRTSRRPLVPAKPQRATADSDSAVVFFHPLLVFFAADAERRFGAGFEALDRNVFAALFARAECAVVDLRQGLRDLVQERLLTTAQPEGERLEIFARREVHLVRQV